MSGEIRSNKPGQPPTTGRLKPASAAQAPGAPTTGQLRQDQAALSKGAAAARARQDNELHSFWESYVVDPLQNAQDYWANMGREGGAAGVTGKVMGTLLDFSGLPSIAENAGVAMDQRQTVKERLKRGGFAAGEIILNFVPLGKLGKVGSKAFKLSGGARVLQRFRNAAKLGAEVKAGTKIMHYTTREAAEKIARSGLLQGSQRGFLSMAGKGEHLVVTARGLKKKLLNNGQVYALAADGKTSRLGKVIDAVVGVGADTRLGKLLGKISPAKTHYGAVVEHVLTAEEAARSVRWGKTIVTNVPPQLKGLAIHADKVKVLAREGAEVAGQVAKNQRVGLGPLDAAVGAVARHADVAGVAYVKTLLAVNRAGRRP